MGYVETIRNDLIRFRRTHGISQREVADIVGVSRTAVSAFETGSSSTMRLKALDRLISLVEQWRSFELPPKDFEKVPQAIQTINAQPSAVVAYACPSCGERVPGPQQDALFCCKCGASLANRCEHCGYAIADHQAKYCAHCGTSLSGGMPVVALIEDDDDLSDTLIAEELAQRVASWRLENVEDVVDMAS